ncbi:MAG: hypothetical protein ACREHG_06935 [Candidatus Saccharimonadales bacterium]
MITQKDLDFLGSLPLKYNMDERDGQQVENIVQDFKMLFGEVLSFAEKVEALHGQLNTILRLASRS